MIHKNLYKLLLKTISLSIVFIFIAFLLSCKKIEREAKVATLTVSEITTTSAKATGDIIDLGNGITDYGHCWNLSANPTIANTKTSLRSVAKTGIFTSYLQNLESGKLYHIRAFVKNVNEVMYGNDLTFTTIPIIVASLTTTVVTSITSTTAVSGGNITADGGGAITARGVCWAITANPTISNSKTTNGTGTGNFTSSITGLIANTRYYIRAYATNNAGTAYGTQELFVTSYGSLTDIDGNIYQTIKIGTQIWTQENLKTTKYKDGTAIPLVTDNTAWAALITPGYCWYNNDAATYKNTYGALYNWFTVNTNKLCPTGWHVPTDPEWTTLTTYLGGESIAGGKLKEIGTSHWISPNTGATNETGFTALPGGYRGYGSVGSNGYWWSSTEVADYYAFDRYIDFNNSNLGNYYPYKQNGNSVRCVSGELILPTLTTISTTSVTTTSAASGGNISSDGGTAITARGVCWSTSHNPTIGNSKTTNGTGTGSFSSTISGLSNNITYYVRAYATNAIGTAYGSENSVILYMNTPSTTITDIDGNVYKTVKIGDQIWMAENLKVTKYRNGNTIPNVTDVTTWASLLSGAYCDFGNNTTNGAIYGHLYNYYTVVDSRQLCPTGWHVPSDTEWTTLTNYLGGENVAGGKLKEVGTTHWDSPNTSADNSSGFTALAGSWRGDGGPFYYHVGYTGNWWTSSEYDNNNGWFWSMAYNSSDALRRYGAYFGKKGGGSIRCLKD